MSLLRCSLETGRTHQIRVHLAAIDHPVVGDPAYGGIRSGIEIARPFLHAATLAFAHPVTGEPQRFASELPPDLVRVLDQSRRLTIRKHGQVHHEQRCCRCANHTDRAVLPESVPGGERVDRREHEQSEAGEVDRVPDPAGDAALEQ